MIGLQRATLIGTIAQVFMGVAGHYLAAVASLFAVGGVIVRRR